MLASQTTYRIVDDQTIINQALSGQTLIKDMLDSRAVPFRLRLYRQQISRMKLLWLQGK